LIGIAVLHAVQLPQYHVNRAFWSSSERVHQVKAQV